MLEAGQLCLVCSYCEKIDDKGGRCRYDPPTVIGIPIQGPPVKGIIQGSTLTPTVTIKQFSFYRPVMLNDKGCGKFSRRGKAKRGPNND